MKLPEFSLPAISQSTKEFVPLVVDFGKGGNSQALKTHGWSDQESDFTWSIGARSGLQLPPLNSETGFFLDLDIHPLAFPPILKGQVLRVWINGLYLGSYILRTRSVVRCRIEASLVDKNKSVEVLFEHPCYARPAGLRYSDDNRPLAVCFHAVRLVALEGDSQSQAWGAPECEIGYLSPLPTTDSVEHAPEVQTYLVDGSDVGTSPLRQGWYGAESSANGWFVWTRGNISVFELPAPAALGRHLFCLDASPYAHPGRLGAQEFTVLLYGFAIGQFRTTKSEAFPTFAMPLPEELVRGRKTLSFVLYLPDAACPRLASGSSDDRTIALACRKFQIESLPSQVHPLSLIRDDVDLSPLASSHLLLDEPPDALPEAIDTCLGIPAVELLRSFESLGSNCEFGIVQRKMGLEVLGLLRFGHVPLKGLLRGLDDRFDAVSDPDDVLLSTNDAVPPEYVLFLQRYGISFHTYVRESDVDQEAVYRQQVEKLGYLRRKFYEGLRSGRRIYVLKQSVPCKLSDILKVFLYLNRSRANTLLWVGPAEGNNKSGSVDLLAPGLMRGHMKAFAPNDDVELSTDPSDWLRLVANAWVLNCQIKSTLSPSFCSNKNVV